MQRVAANLQAVGGAVDPEAAAWIGLGPPPPGRPSISLGDEVGTLGPRSFGFLNNVDGVAPLAAPIPERPRRGGVALVVPRRDALPELVPLLLRRRMGLSWLISVGDGDPADVLRFLAADPATSGVLLALGRGSRAATLHGVLGSKQAALLELPGIGTSREGMLCRAVARRAGVPLVSELEAWLAHGSMYDVAARPARGRAAVVVLGAGADLVAAEAQRARLPPPHVLEPDDPALEAALAQLSLNADVVLLCGDPEDTVRLTPPRPTLRVDPSRPEQLRALMQAVAQRAPAPADSKPVQVRPDRERLHGLLTDLPPPLYADGHMVLDEPLSDHDTKRLLRAYGVRVSRQAPANTVTAAQRVAAQIGLPVVLVPAGDVEEVACRTTGDLKRQATLLLQRAPHILVREWFPESPRVRLVVVQERGLGPVLRIDEEAALVPLLRGEARELAEGLAATYDVDPRGLADMLAQISSVATEHTVTLDLQLHVSDAPAVVAASGTLRRPAP
ncbi:MAG: hypothetical protein RMK29_00975 [Myxococcales bacterium]|nr:hypothetical protein [Myxococcales bacterium]